EEMKFSGNLYDVLNTKLLAFYDICRKVDLPKEQYHEAYSIMLSGRALDFYYNRLSNREYDFDTMVRMTRTHFETEENRQLYWAEWRETTFSRVITENPTKNRLECLQLLFDKLQKIQRGMSEVYQTEHNLRDMIINACRGVEECELALYKPANTFEGVCSELQSAVGTAMRRKRQDQFITEDNAQYDQNWTDRTYGGRGRYQGRGGSSSRGSSRRGSFRGGHNKGGDNSRQKKCYVCERIGCWSSKHTFEERKAAYAKFRQ
ncbi:hypothetical protein OIDMADRAFT_71369, partial [Oidiodendron maius Zn]